MNVQLDPQFRIVSDDKQFILQQVKTKGNTSSKVGEEYVMNVAYASSLENALQSYVRHKTLQSNAQDLKSLIQEIRGLKQYIQNITEEETK